MWNIYSLYGFGLGKRAANIDEDASTPAPIEPPQNYDGYDRGKFIHKVIQFVDLVNEVLIHSSGITRSDVGWAWQTLVTRGQFRKEIGRTTL